MTKTAKLLGELIALPSVNPAFLPVRDPRAGEQGVAEYLGAAASRQKLDLEFQPVLPKRNNLLIYLRPTGKVRHRLVLAPHLDTVGGDERTTCLFTPQFRQGRVYGRGACDTKGSVAAMFAAVCALAKRRQRPAHTEIVFAGLVDEEFKQAGSWALVKRRFKADLAIVGEPTRLKVVTAHKGVLWMRLQTRGRAAHGARPELGSNAVHDMARVVDALLTDYTTLLQAQHHPLLGIPSLNVGRIEGGHQPNIVPDECVIQLDRRTLPGEKEAHVIRGMKTFLRDRALPVHLQRMRAEACLPLETNPQLPWVQQMLCNLGQTRPVGVDYFTDAGVLAQGGIPSVVFGPGDIAQAHTPNEWIDLKQLERSREMLVHFLESLP